MPPVPPVPSVRVHGVCASLLLSVLVLAAASDAAMAQEAAVATPAVPTTISPAPAVPTISPAPPSGGDAKLEEFTPLPGSTPWPTVESTTAAGGAIEVGDVRYSVVIEGLSSLGLQDEYQSLSSLWTKKGSPANLAQINRRIAEDRDLIDQLLRSVGHYGGQTAVAITAPAAGPGATVVKLVVTPGPLYTFAAVSAGPTEGAQPLPPGLVEPLLGVKAGDSVDAARVTLAQTDLPQKLADAGYPFPRVIAPEIIVDHANRTATLVQKLDLGSRAVFGHARMDTPTARFPDAHLAVLARFTPGAPYKGSEREDLRRALVLTGLFSVVSIKPVAAGPPNADGTQTVDLVVTTEMAPPRTIATTAGYSTGQGIRVEASWQNRNLFPPEGAFTVRGVGAEREQLLSAEIRRHNFRRRDQTLATSAILSAEELDAFAAKTFELSAILDRQSVSIYQKRWTYSAGVEALVTQQRDRSAIGNPLNIYYIVALPGSVTYDASDDLLNPAKGFRLTARISPELTLRSGNYLNYFKAQVEGSIYQPLGPVILAARLHLGSIVGADRGSVAPSRRFYAGGGGSVRGYNYQGVGPKDAGNSPLGGNGLTEASFEIRYRFTAFGSDVGLVPFVDAGRVYSKSLPGFSDLKYGAGLGFRYYSGFGPIRIDIATPVNPDKGDPKVAFYVSIGQAF